MEYNKNKLITDDGANLVAQSLQEGKKVNFDSFIVTDTPLPSDRQLSAMTIDNFKNMRKYPITNLKKGKNSVQPEAKLDNNGLTDDYAIYAVGLLANISESNTILFGITQNSEGTPAMLTKQTTTPYFITYDMGITVTNPDNYQATITPAGYVDQTTFNNEIENIHTDISNIDLSGAVKQANDYTDTKVNNLDSETSNGISNLGKLIQPLLDVDEIKKDVNNRFGNYQKGLDGKQDDVSLSVKDNKLYYAGTPVLTATTPNQPKISVKLNGDTGNLSYQITPPDLDGGASITNYVISYRIITDENWKTLQVNGTTFSGEISDIQKGQTYQVKVTATNYAGKSIESEAKQVITAIEPSGVSIDVSNDYPNGIKYNINVSNNGGLDNLYYQIFYKKDNDNVWQFVDHPSQNGNLLKIVDGGNYQFKAKAGNLVGLSEESAINEIAFGGKNYVLFNQRTAFLGSKAGQSFSYENTVLSGDIPSFTAPFNLKNRDIKIDFLPNAYFYKNGYDASTYVSSRSILIASIIVNGSDLISGNYINIIPKLNINDIKSYSASLFVKLINDNTIGFFNYNYSDEDMNYDSGGSDDHFTVPVLERIVIL